MFEEDNVQHLGPAPEAPVEKTKAALITDRGEATDVLIKALQSISPEVLRAALAEAIIDFAPWYQLPEGVDFWIEVHHTVNGSEPTDDTAAE